MISRNFSLSGRTALVTGAAGYLGSMIATALAEAGAHVLVNSRSAERSEKLVAELREVGLSAESAVFDVADEAAVRDFFEARGNIAINILVNNAYVGAAGSVASATPENYRQSYEISVVAAHNLFVAALPAMRRGVAEHGDAAVINIASMYAMVSPDQRIYDAAISANPPFYGAAKAALLQWTRYAACEFGPEKIRFNSVSPGPFPSAAVQVRDPAFVQRLVNKVPLGRVGQQAEIGGPVVFLASPAASFVNGANLVVDGGWTCW